MIKYEVTSREGSAGPAARTVGVRTPAELAARNKRASNSMPSRGAPGGSRRKISSCRALVEGSTASKAQVSRDAPPLKRVNPSMRRLITRPSRSARSASSGVGGEVTPQIVPLMRRDVESAVETSANPQTAGVSDKPEELAWCQCRINAEPHATCRASDAPE